MSSIKTKIPGGRRGLCKWEALKLKRHWFRDTDASPTTPSSASMHHRSEDTCKWPRSTYVVTVLFNSKLSASISVHISAEFKERKRNAYMLCFR